MHFESEVSSHYQGEAGAQYVAHYQRDPLSVGYELEAAYFRPYLSAADVALDFGCGNGGIAHRLCDDVARVEGLEVNPHAASIARSLGLEVHPSLAAIPEAARYDVVYSNHVLEHVRDPATTLEGLRARMKPGARLLLKLPIDDWRARHQRGWSETDIDRHLHTWTPRLAGNLLYEAGFEVADIRVVTSAYHPKLFPLHRSWLSGMAFWALSVLKKRRQLFVRGRVPA